jgi:hypothetical protein
VVRRRGAHGNESQRSRLPLVSEPAESQEKIARSRDDAAQEILRVCVIQISVMYSAKIVICVH